MRREGGYGTKDTVRRSYAKVSAEEAACKSYVHGRFVRAASPLVVCVRFACSMRVSGYAGSSFHDFFEAEKGVER